MLLSNLLILFATNPIRFVLLLPTRCDVTSVGMLNGTMSCKGARCLESS